jgi:3-phenylpropionate/cinnamic acid dioxygenase small subunit
MSGAIASSASIAAVAAFVYREARLLDDFALEEWLTLFTADGIYWVPIDDAKPVASNAALIYDDTLRREERVHHQLHISTISQSPRSRTVHAVSNVEIVRRDGDALIVRSVQVIYEMRTGDFRQIGLGEVRANIATVEHVLHPSDDTFKIASKKVLLIDRDAQLRNLTFLL